MKAPGLSLWLLLAAARLAAATRAGQMQTPITRVVKLLEGLALKTEMEGKIEEKLYEKFVCWAKGIIDSKTASNLAGKGQTETLEAHIADVNAGRIDFTGEQGDLTKELQGINGDMETAKALRAEERAQFEDAEAEMTKAITALDKAIAVLKEATEDHAEGTLLAQQQRLDEERSRSFAARVQESAALAHAVELGQRVLSAGDAVFLRRLLTGDVPEPDWKKLNRKATFKMSYKARSFKIQAVLAKMKETFESSLKDAQAKEAEAKALSDKLQASKTSQKLATEEALQKLDVEMGARQVSKEQAQEEVDALTSQLSEDTKFIQQTEAQLAEKKAEWKERKALRAGEVAAMRKAISILYSDDARDLMKKSFASQGYSLVQESSEHLRLMEQRRTSAVEVLRRAGTAGSDARLAALALRVAARGGGGEFAEVFRAIDTMLATLKTEEDSDLAKKEQCEKDRSEDTRSAIKTSREMDDATDAIAKLQAEIAEIKEEITEKGEAQQAARDELAEATKLRGSEHKEFVESKADDEEMGRTVEKAASVLKSFYTENGLMLLQQRREPVPEGQAPLPPPSTWEGGYQGKTQQSSGVLATLRIVKEDIDKDMAEAKQAEDKAAARFAAFKKESEDQIKALGDAISTLTGTKGQKEESASQQASLRLDQKGSLHAVLTKISDANPGCQYVTVNYPTRLANRQVEMDGLHKAKAILAGAEFTESNEDRPLKPGDALFLQGRLR